MCIISGDVKSEISYISKHNANIAQSYLENLQTTSKALAMEVNRYRSLDRESAERMLKNSLTGILKDDRIFSAYYAFEPDKFFEGTPEGLSYYAFRDGSEIVMDVYNDYDTYSPADYYAPARDTISTHITEPYSYELSTGETVWLITLSNPIIDANGEFIINEGNRSIDGNRKTFVVHSPVKISGFDKSWSSVFVVDQSEALAPVRNVTLIVTAIAIAGVLILALMALAILKKSLSPLNYVINMAEQMGTEMESSNSQMQNLLEAMKAIEDITFQTNILALNAAVEAARAGSAAASEELFGQSQILDNLIGKFRIK